MAKANKMAKKKATAKKPSTKTVFAEVWCEGDWTVKPGKLVPGRGRPTKMGRIFQWVAEKLPLTCLSAVKKDMNEDADHLEGVYLAHDSMGHARYGGRGQIFNRLAAHKRKYPRELVYFSFYVVKDKKHER